MSNRGESQSFRDSVRDVVSFYLQTMQGEDHFDLYAVLIEQTEIPMLEVVVQHTHGNQTRAAQLLGISRGTLRKKLAQYNLE